MPRFRLQINRPWGTVGLEAESVEEAVASVEKLLELSAALERSLSKESQLPQREAAQVLKAKRRRGRSEAVLALDAIERHLLNSGFFSTPRSTSEVRQKIHEVTGLRLQSRKVSQALGILYESKKIMRVGPKGNYKWFVK